MRMRRLVPMVLGPEIAAAHPAPGGPNTPLRRAERMEGDTQHGLLWNAPQGGDGEATEQPALLEPGGLPTSLSSERRQRQRDAGHKDLEGPHPTHKQPQLAQHPNSSPPAQPSRGRAQPVARPRPPARPAHCPIQPSSRNVCGPLS